MIRYFMMIKQWNMQEINILYNKENENMGYVLTGRATDIYTSEQELCYILGYLARPGRIKYIEAQVPYGKEQKFMNAYPGANFDNMKITSDKQSFQFRIILNYNGNCPQELEEVLTSGGGPFNKNCISRGKFIERIINEYGFEFFNAPDPNVIRSIVQRKHPGYLIDFEEGYSIPLSGRC